MPELESLIDFFNRKRLECPRGVTLRLEKEKYLLYRFKLPGCEKNFSRACGLDFNEEGIILAVARSKKISQAIKSFKKASEFWEFFDIEVLGKNYLENDLKSYREIFKEIENEYFNGWHKNTKRKRDRNHPSDITSFKRSKEIFFNKIKTWDDYPDFKSLETALFSWKQGSKSFKDAFYFYKDVGNRSAKRNEILEGFSKIDPKQNIFAEKESCSWNDFFNWHQDSLKSASGEDAQWLWVFAMMVVYGLRPSEILACSNLDKSLIVGDIKIPAISDLGNKSLLLAIDEFTIFGTSTKTGSRIARPMILDKEIIDILRIKQVGLPKFDPPSNKDLIVSAFSMRLSKELKRLNSPTLQSYAFRHLSNQLGEKYGIAQEIRSRSLGHSTIVNERIYKSRSNISTEIDLLTNSRKQDINLDLLRDQLRDQLSDEISIERIDEILKNIFSY